MTSPKQQTVSSPRHDVAVSLVCRWVFAHLLTAGGPRVAGGAGAGGEAQAGAAVGAAVGAALRTLRQSCEEVFERIHGIHWRFLKRSKVVVL